MSRSATSVEEELFIFCTEILDTHSNDTPPSRVPTTASSPCNNFLFTTTIQDAPLDRTSNPDSEEKENKEQQTPTLPTQSNDHHPPFTASWIVARLRDSPERAIGILRTWAHDKRLDIDDITIAEINSMEEGTAIEAVEELKTPRVFVKGTKGSKLALPTTIVTLDTRKEHKANALLDSGCEGSCIDTKYVQQLGLNTTPLPRPIAVFNADGSRNTAGSITDYITLELRIDDHWERIDFGVTNLGKGQVFLGHDWLQKHNPSIDWNEGTLSFDRCPYHCRPNVKTYATDFDFEDEPLPELINDEFNLEDGDRLLLIDTTPALQLRAYSTRSTELAAAAHAKKEQKPFGEIVPSYLHDFEDVFTKKDFDELPPHRPWDHAIEIVEGKEPRLNCKVYPLSRDEQRQLDEFVEEHLRTGRIRESISPMTSPFFFVKKKDGALRPVQDYRKLNDMTVKNNYPLPLISELINSLQEARYFTKLDI